jgi:hypothetical protein
MSNNMRANEYLRLAKLAQGYNELAATRPHLLHAMSYTPCFVARQIPLELLAHVLLGRKGANLPGSSRRRVRKYQLKLHQDPISVIIAHYAPNNRYRDILVQTIKTIRNQDYSGQVEIAVSDDGSLWSNSLLKDGETAHIFNRTEIEHELLLQDLDIDWYVVGRRTNHYNKAILWNIAVSATKADNIVFLDDDHAFLRQNALTLYNKYFQKYQFIIGRILNPKGDFRLFDDRTVQGANFGIKRTLLNAVGNFGEYTSLWGAGEDSDIFWKMYQNIGKDNRRNKQACYAGEIITKDLCSGRWANCVGGKEVFFKGFIDIYGVHPRHNPSRDKETWIEHTAVQPFLVETWYKLRNLSQKVIYITSKILSIIERGKTGI